LKIERPVTNQVQETITTSTKTALRSKNARSTEKLLLQFYEVQNGRSGNYNLEPIGEYMIFQPIIRKTALKRKQPWNITGNIRIHRSGDLEYMEPPRVIEHKPVSRKRKREDSDLEDKPSLPSSPLSFPTSELAVDKPSEDESMDVSSKQTIGSDLISQMIADGTNVSKEEVYSSLSSLLQLYMVENDNLRQEVATLRYQILNINQQWTLDPGSSSILTAERNSYLDLQGAQYSMDLDTDNKESNKKRKIMLVDKDPILNPGCIEIFSVISDNPSG